MKPTEILAIIKETIGESKITLSPAEFAQITGYSYQTIYKMVRAGKLNHTQKRTYGRIRIDFREVGRLIEGKITAP